MISAAEGALRFTQRRLAAARDRSAQRGSRRRPPAPTFQESSAGRFYRWLFSCVRGGIRAADPPPVESARRANRFAPEVIIRIGHALALLAALDGVPSPNSVAMCLAPP